MRIFLDCIPCFVRQALDSARLATDDEQIHEQVVREVLRLAAGLDMSQSPPAIGQQIHRLIRKLVGHNDPYHRILKPRKTGMISMTFDGTWHMRMSQCLLKMEIGI